MYRNVTSQDFQGKTVVSVDTSVINVLKFQFSDGTSLELCAETIRIGGNYIYQIYSCFYIDDQDKQQDNRGVNQNLT